MFTDDADAVMAEGTGGFEHCAFIKALAFVFAAADVHLALIPSACALVDSVIRYLVQRSGVLVVNRRRACPCVCFDLFSAYFQSIPEPAESKIFCFCDP